MKKSTIALFICAAGLLVFAGANGARAALNYYSDNVQGTLQFDSMDVSVLENGKALEEDALTLNGDEELTLGTQYDDTISVKNTGSMDAYVRLQITRYWVDSDGNKLTNLSPDLIDIAFSDDSTWYLDDTSSTEERAVYYYTSPLAAGQTTSDLMTGFSISNELGTKLTSTTTTEDGKTTVTYEYAYDGATFVIEAKADCVQTHNGEDAILSAWGKQVTLSSDGSIKAIE